jgi:hypothetical protein
MKRDHTAGGSTFERHSVGLPVVHLDAVCVQVPYYNKLVNIIWGGLWLRMLDVVAVLLALQLTISKQADPEA